MNAAVGPAPWSAEILRGEDPAHAARIAQLTADPAIEVLDSLDGQWGELRKILPAAEPDLYDEAARWAYYPWRRTLVRILGPRGFRLVRLDRNRNKITREEQDAFAGKVLGVVGLSVGHAIAHTMALQGLCGEIRLADFDTIELSNLNRIPASILDLDVNKAVVVGRRIAELDPYLRVVVFDEGLTDDSMADFVDGLDILIEECDSLDMKLLVREAARKQRIPLIMETSDRGLLDVERYDLEPDRPLFHGLLGDTTASDLRGLSTHDKVPHVLRILEPAELSARMAASMTEVDQTLKTWPQLGGDVTLGAASVAAAVTRINRGAPLASGRTRIDMDAVLDALVQPPLPTGTYDDLDVDDTWLKAPDDARAAVAHAAGLAPSGGNTQPWTMDWDDDDLVIGVQTSRTSKMDVHYRGSLVGIGAALYNAQAAASAHGILGAAQVAEGDLAGAASRPVVRLSLGAGADPDLAARYPAVLTRSSNRQFGTGGTIDADLAARLTAAAASRGATLHLVLDRAVIEAAGELIAESDRMRYLDEILHRQMMSELSWPGLDNLDVGLDVRTLELDESDLAKLGVAKRRDVMAYLDEWGVGRALGDVARERIATAAGLAILTVTGNQIADYVRGGQALQELWITAQAAGLGVHPTSPVFLYAEDPEDFASLSEKYAGALRDLSGAFRELCGIGNETFILILRLSWAPAASIRSRRLPIDALAAGNPEGT
ncbi:MAG: UBA/THIF-type binding protein [Pseudonocardiales bacterium]|nr:UBA/THIF-type binding protein [Pseudonocardiales bacterium]